MKLPVHALIILSAVASSLHAQATVLPAGERKMARVLYGGDLEPAGQIVIEHGAPTWRAAYAELLMPGEDLFFRLGSDFWASMHTTYKLRVGRTEIPAGVWYLGLHRTSKEEWGMTLVDASKAIRRNQRAGMDAIPAHDVRIPMTYRKLEREVAQLTVELQPQADKVDRAALTLRWGPHSLAAQIAVPVAMDEAPRGPEFTASSAENTVTTASGLKYEVVREGEGTPPTANDRVTVHYSGWLTDGTPFDSSHRRGQPATFPLSGVIKGWTEGVQLMAPGAVYRFTIPPELAYGERGAPPRIPPNATLVFDIELIRVN